MQNGSPNQEALVAQAMVWFALTGAATVAVTLAAHFH